MKRSFLVVALSALVLSLAVPVRAGYFSGPDRSGAGARAVTLNASPPAVGIVVPPTPVPGNPITYWRDGAGNVVGISRKGQLVWLEMPAGEVHVGPAAVASGYGLDRDDGGIAENDYDIYDSASSPGAFQAVSIEKNLPGGSTYPGKLITRQLVVTAVVRTPDGNTRLTNVWKWKPRSRAVSLTQTWRNTSSGISYLVFAPKLYIDVDNSGVLTNHFGRTSQTLFSWLDPDDSSPAYNVILSTQSSPFCINAATPAFLDFGGCDGTHLAGGTPTYAGDAAFAVNLGIDRIFAPGMKQVEKFQILVK